MTTSATTALLSKNGQRVRNTPQVTKISSNAVADPDRAISRDQHLLSPPPVRIVTERRDSNRKVGGSHAMMHKRNMSIDIRGIPSETAPTSNALSRSPLPVTSTSLVTLAVSKSAIDSSDSASFDCGEDQPDFWFRHCDSVSLLLAVTSCADTITFDFVGITRALKFKSRTGTRQCRHSAKIRRTTQFANGH